MEDYQKLRFRELPEVSRKAIIALARAAAQDPSGHLIHVGQSGNPRKPYSFEVILSDKSRAFVGETNSNLREFLAGQGFVDLDQEGGHKRFPFKREVLAWLMEEFPPDETMMRESVGRYFYESSLKGDDGLQGFDARAVAQQLMLPVDGVKRVTMGLAGSGILANKGPRGAGIPPYYVLSEQGFRWAIGGFKADIGFNANVTVNIDLRVEIQQVIEQIERLPLADDTKQQYELTARRLESELQKPRPRLEVFKDALEMAANSKELMVPIVSILANHKDQLLQAVQSLPIL